MSCGLQKMTYYCFTSSKFPHNLGVPKDARSHLKENTKKKNPWLCSFIRQSIFTRSPLMCGWCIQASLGLAASAPSCNPLGSPCSSRLGSQGDRKNTGAVTESGRTPAGFHYRQAKGEARAHRATNTAAVLDEGSHP